MKRTVFIVSAICVAALISLTLTYNNKGKTGTDPVLLQNVVALTQNEGPQLDCNYEIVKQEDCVISGELKLLASLFGYDIAGVKGDGSVILTGMQECRIVQQNGMTCKPVRCDETLDKLMKAAKGS